MQNLVGEGAPFKNHSGMQQKQQSQQEQQSRWNAAGTTITLECSRNNNHDGMQQEQQSRWNAAGTTITAECSRNNGA
jgi:hypothetical protein